MAQDEQDAQRIVLPAILDLTRAPALKQELQAALAAGHDVVVDAGAVQRLCSLCLQLLVAARSAGPLRIEPRSPTFDEFAGVLGLNQALGLAGGENG